MAAKKQTKRRKKTAGEYAPGRPSSASSKSDRIRELLASGMKPGDIAKAVDCSRNLVYLVRNKAGGARTAGTRGPGRPRKVAARRGRRPGVDAPLAAVQELVSNLEKHARENARMRETLEEIGRMIDRVM